MNLDDINSEIEHAKWFSLLGSYVASEGYLALRNLHAWDKTTFTSNFNKKDAQIASEMDWLPSSKEEDDPIHGHRLTEFLEENDVQFKPIILDIHKRALTSLRSVESMKLRSGPNNFTQAALGAALYCVRMAVLEVMADKVGFWCALLRLYGNGYWPCGILLDKTVLVY